MMVHNSDWSENIYALIYAQLLYIHMQSVSQVDEVRGTDLKGYDTKWDYSHDETTLALNWKSVLHNSEA